MWATFPVFNHRGFTNLLQLPWKGNEINDWNKELKVLVL